MSCWSGFWFFVSCHSVMAFPSFTIRWTGAELLCFHFPRVSNSRWPGDAFSSVLLHEHFTTWSITYSECSSSWRVSQRDRACLNFFNFPNECTCPHTSLYIFSLSLSLLHRVINVHKNRGYFWVVWVNPCIGLYLISFFRNMVLISKCTIQLKLKGERCF